MLVHAPPIGIPPDFQPYEAGYLVTRELDTLTGAIKAHKPGQSWIEFRDEENYQSRWTAEELLFYQAGKKQYETHAIHFPWEGEPTVDFLRVWERGPLTLFSRTVKRLKGKGGGKGPRRLAETYWFVQREGNLLRVPRFTFHKTMAHYFQDVPDLAEKLRQEQYQYKDMPKLVTLYNQAIYLSTTEPDRH